MEVDKFCLMLLGRRILSAAIAKFCELCEFPTLSVSEGGRRNERRNSRKFKIPQNAETRVHTLNHCELQLQPKSLVHRFSTSYMTGQDFWKNDILPIVSALRCIFAYSVHLR